MKAFSPEIIEKAQKSVFGISLAPIDSQRPFFERSDFNVRGTGFHIGRGYVATNHHVITTYFIDKDLPPFIADEITLISFDRKEYSAKLIGTDESYDLAVYHIRGAFPEDIATFAEQEARSGMEAFVIGYPMGPERISDQKISYGWVGNPNKELKNIGLRLFELNADVCHGNSGSPIFNAQGVVIGIIESIFQIKDIPCSSFAFAISSHHAKKIIEDIIRYGKARHAWIGVDLRYEKYHGEWFPAVEKIIAGSPAERSGLKIGDIILSISGKPVRKIIDVKRIILEQSYAGEMLVLRVIRDGHERAITTMVVERLGKPPQ
ncbi:MAG: S1C family serine protease [Patescibacteria group bacterium]